MVQFTIPTKHSRIEIHKFLDGHIPEIWELQPHDFEELPILVPYSKHCKCVCKIVAHKTSYCVQMGLPCIIFCLCNAIAWSTHSSCWQGSGRHEESQDRFMFTPQSCTLMLTMAVNSSRLWLAWTNPLLSSSLKWNLQRFNLAQQTNSLNHIKGSTAVTVMF